MEQAELVVAGGHGRVLDTAGPGEAVGEMALIDHRPRSATVVAESPMTLLAFDTKAFANT